MQITAEEIKRLAVLQSYGILDTDFEESFDRITRLSAHLFNTPISVVSLVDEDRQWFKSVVGLEVRETARDIAFCTHAIRGDEVFVIPDAREDERFKSNPLVTDDPHIRFYAGAPLKTPEGYNLGTICVIDREERISFGDEYRHILRDFAGLVMELLNSRRAARRADDLLASLEVENAEIAKAVSGIRLSTAFAGQIDAGEMVGEIRKRAASISDSLSELKRVLADLERSGD